MSMHLIRGVQVHGKSKIKKKPGWKQREEEHRQWLIRMGVDPDKKPEKKKAAPYVPPKDSYGRETSNYPSLSNNMTGSTAKKESQKYTGDYIIGITTTHKSNLVPVTSKKQAEEAAQMRRN
jgi:hypothetical protein